MKIDLHTHTKKCKTGDAQTREITPRDFCNVLLSTDVGIVAITNHNAFDFVQFKDIEAKMNQDVQVWPGIELDVHEESSRGHLLVIVSPAKAKAFTKIVDGLTEGTTPDSFATSIDEVLEKFDALEPLYIAHYGKKMPNISDVGLEKLLSRTANSERVIKEVTNSISAGIYISHGHTSIYGSDIQNWQNYETESNSLPDLRLPVESFEQFCMLLEKDSNAINTALDQKNPENLLLTPFEDGTILPLKVFNDINIIFGPKGTGKTCILEAIAKHYSESGIDAEVYTSASDRLHEIFDLRGKNASLNLDSYNINYCKDEIEFLREASESDVTSITKYLSYFRIETTNKKAKRIKLKNIDTEEEGGPKREFREFNEGVETTLRFLEFLEQHPSTPKVINEEELKNLSNLLKQLLERLSDKKWGSFSEWKEVCLLNSAIEKFRVEIERKTGSPAKPTTTGFRKYALNRVKIAAKATEILRAMDTEIPTLHESVGSIGANKGDLELRTEFKFQNGSVTDREFNKLKGVKKASQKQFAKKVRDILEHAYLDNLFEHITALNEIEDVSAIETVYELLLFKRYFSLEEKRYTPSSGEASMVMLHKELETEKEVYILDEPERSLGHEYISDVIVPLLKERARIGKKVFISTHDANIAVRTLPYSSVFRCHDSDGYTTYIGNPFSNNLINPEDNTDIRDWKKVSMKTLEGGEEAFEERGKIYGNT